MGKRPGQIAGKVAAAKTREAGGKRSHKRPAPAPGRKPKLSELALLPEPHANLSVDRTLCQLCSLFKLCKRPYMKPFVPTNWSGKMLLVLEAPGGDEDDHTGRPATGEAGQLLRKLWLKAGLRDQDVAITNSVVCRPRGDATPSMQQVRCCRPFLLRVCGVLRPRNILGMGVVALHALTNKHAGSITGTRGKSVEVPGLRDIILAEPDSEPGKTWGSLATEMPNVRISFNPSAILRGAIHLEDIIVQDLKQITNKHYLPLPTNAPFFTQTVSVDTEFDKEGILLTMGVGMEHQAIASEMWEDPCCEPPHDPAWLDVKATIERADRVAGHSVMGDIDHLVPMGLAKEEWLQGKNVRDSLILWRMIDENRGKGSYGLEKLMLAEKKVEPWKGLTDAILQQTGNARDWPAVDRQERCRLDAWASAVLVKEGEIRLAEEVSDDLINFTHRIAATLHRIWLAGSAVNIYEFDQLGKKWQREANRKGDQLTKLALKHGMTEFSPSNDNHKRELFYDRMGLKATRKTEKEGLAAVDKTALKPYKDLPEVKLALEEKAVAKLASTWYGSENSKRKSLRELVVPIHGTNLGFLQNRINPLGARTGRRSSGGQPEEGMHVESRNSQNWPAAARVMVCSRWPGGKILDADYKRLEVVLIAWRASDEKLLEYFTTGDGYIGIAAELFNRNVEEGSRDYRVMKAIVLGTDYNMGPWKLAKDLWEIADIKFSEIWKEHQRIAAEIRLRYLAMFPGLARYIEARKHELAETQRVLSPSGRVRHLKHWGPQTPMYWHFENQAVNQPIQSFASDVTGSAMIDIEDALLAEHDMSYLEYHKLVLQKPLEIPFSVLINEVHDSLISDIHPGTGKKDVEIIVETMRGVPSLRKLVPDFKIPLNVDIKIGPRWGVKDNG